MIYSLDKIKIEKSCWRSSLYISQSNNRKCYAHDVFSFTVEDSMIDHGLFSSSPCSSTSSQHGLFLQMGPPEESWCRLDCEEDVGDEGDETIESRLGGEEAEGSR